MPILRVARLEATRGDRIGVVGPNGAGKTTLLRTVAGVLSPLDGFVRLGANVQPGYLAQIREAPIPGATVMDAILAAARVENGPARSYLARFLFRGEDVFKPVAELSGGERSRLELALLGITPANLLLLDEPTNHLDIPAREALESFLRTSPSPRCSSCPTTGACSNRSAAACGWSSPGVGAEPGAVAVFDGGYTAWRAAVADGWTVTEALDRAPIAQRVGGVGGPRRPARQAAGSDGARAPQAPTLAADRPTATAPRATRQPPLSKDAYKRQMAARRGGPHPARGAQEPAGAGPRRPEGPDQLRGAATPDQRAGRCRWRPGPGRGGVAGPVGTRAAMTRHAGDRTIPHRPDRAHRLRQVHRRPDARPTGCHGHRCRRAGPGRHRPGGADARAHPRPVRGRGVRGGRIARPCGAGTHRVRGPGRARRPGGDRPSRVCASWSRRPWTIATESGAPFAVVEAIKLVEGGLADRCDEVWLVDCPEDVQRERLAGRGMAADDIDRRIAAQSGLRERLAPRVTRARHVRRARTRPGSGSRRPWRRRWPARSTSCPSAPSNTSHSSSTPGAGASGHRYLAPETRHRPHQTAPKYLRGRGGRAIRPIPTRPL